MAQRGQFSVLDIDPQGQYRPDQAGSLDDALGQADLTSWMPAPVKAAANVVGKVRDALSMRNVDAATPGVGGLLTEDALRLPQSKTELALQAAALLPAGRIARAARPTVTGALRNSFPEIYGNVADLVRKAAARVDPESPLLKQVFGVTRDEVFDISKQGTRQGNIFTTDQDRPFKTAKNPKGAKIAPQVTGPDNTQRMQDIIGEAQKYPQLYEPMASWYTMDPLFDHFKLLYGDDAVDAYNRFNSLVGMASPGSDVLTEINRGTGAHWLATEGRFPDFKKYAGMAEDKRLRSRKFPDDMSGILGHPFHSTSQAKPMEKYLAAGAVDMDSAKVPSYIAASGVPETGFQTRWPVGDAHWSRLVGLSDVRPGEDFAVSASVPEMVSLSPWWREKVAAPMGLEAVPAQAVVWGAGSGATGVTSPIGAGKLELLAMKIGDAAKRLGVSPEKARDLILSGKAHAALAGGLLGGGALTGFLQSQHPLDSPEPEYQDQELSPDE